MLTWTALSPTEYQSQRWAMICAFEGLVLRPYCDIRGFVTIGVGFKIQSASDPYQSQVFDAVGLPQGSSARASLQALFEDVYAQVAGGKLSTSQGTSFVQQQADGIVAAALGSGKEFAISNSDAETLFNGGVAGYEAAVDRWCAGIPACRERLALFSLEWNGILSGSPSLQRAIQAGERAEGWYQIRYNSNGGSSRSLGIETRRTCEAGYLGLYDNPAAVSPSEGQSVLACLNSHQGQIASIEQDFPTAVAKALQNYAALLPALSGQTIPTLAEAKAPAEAAASAMV